MHVLFLQYFFHTIFSARQTIAIEYLQQMFFPIFLVEDFSRLFLQLSFFNEKCNVGINNMQHFI